MSQIITPRSALALALLITAALVVFWGPTGATGAIIDTALVMLAFANFLAANSFWREGMRQTLTSDGVLAEPMLPRDGRRASGHPRTGVDDGE